MMYEMHCDDVLKINKIKLYACVMMYENVMFLAGENKSRFAAGECEKLNSSFPLRIMNEDDYEHIPAGENNSDGE